MKSFLFSICMLTSLLSLCQTKRAFVVAISEYEDFQNWKRISSVEDLPYIRTALHKFGFTDQNIDTLKNQEATKVGILQGLDRLAQKSSPGDIILFFFCGHGQQIMDNNGQPDEDDGYDEALVAYDAKGQYNPTGYTGEYHLRDDELNEKLKIIHDRIGANGSLLVMIDACHSGSATRADAFMIARGSAKPFESTGYKPLNKIGLGGVVGGFAERAALPNMVLISASGPDQLNYQTRDENGEKIGVLSYAFAKACFELAPGDSYNLLFEKMKARIQANKPTQVPIMEGDGKRQIFSANFTKTEEIIAVNASQWINDTSFYFNRGYLHDLTAGSQFHLSPLGKNELAARGYVARVEAIQSVGVVPKGIDKNSGFGLAIDEVLPENMEAAVFLSGKGNRERVIAIHGQLKQMIALYPWMRVADPADMMIEVSSGIRDTLTLIDKNGMAVYEQYLDKGQSLTPENWKVILKSINNQVRINYIRDLPDGGSLAKGITAKVIPVNKQVDPERSEYVFAAGDQFSLSLQNNSGKTVYYTLVNITPGNEIKVLVPYDGKPPADCQLRDEGVYTTPLLEITKGTPSGKEVFKLILSEAAIDLRPIIKRLAQPTQRGGQTPVEKLFNDMYSEEEMHLTKKRNMSAVAIDKMGVLTIGYSIK